MNEFSELIRLFILRIIILIAFSITHSSRKFLKIKLKYLITLVWFYRLSPIIVRYEFFFFGYFQYVKFSIPGN